MFSVYSLGGESNSENFETGRPEFESRTLDTKPVYESEDDKILSETAELNFTHIDCHG